MFVVANMRRLMAVTQSRNAIIAGWRWLSATTANGKLINADNKIHAPPLQNMNDPESAFRAALRAFHLTQLSNGSWVFSCLAIWLFKAITGLRSAKRRPAPHPLNGSEPTVHWQHPRHSVPLLTMPQTALRNAASSF